MWICAATVQERTPRIDSCIAVDCTTSLDAPGALCIASFHTTLGLDPKTSLRVHHPHSFVNLHSSCISIPVTPNSRVRLFSHSLPLVRSKDVNILTRQLTIVIAITRRGTHRDLLAVWRTTGKKQASFDESLRLDEAVASRTKRVKDQHN